MDKIDVIFANRKNCFERKGGDTVQMMKTKEFLEKAFDVNIKICLTPEEIIADKTAQIVHIFNLETINETNEFIKAAKQTNKKVVLSTIHWNLLDTYYVKYLEYLNIPPIDVPNIVKQILISIFNFFILNIPALRNSFKEYVEKGLCCTKRYKESRQNALKSADLLLPNSYEEMILCADDFGLDRNYIKDKSIVVPNATDFTVGTDEIIDEFNLPQNYVVIAGRIDSTKNQYNIVRALFNDKEIGIVIVGRVQNEKTFQRINKLAQKRGNVFFLNQVLQEKLVAIYKNAICHCLPSFYDTTGLVNIEALLCGCPIVVSNSKHCPVEFYEFGKFGEICDPYSPKSIRNAVYKILENNKRVEISNDYKYKISYENVAKLTFLAYERLLKGKVKNEIQC